MLAARKGLTRFVAAQAAIKPQRLIVPSRMIIGQAQRTFASFDQIERASQKLNKALDSEIKYENENYT